MEEKKYYGKEFYNLLQNGSYISAKKVLPIVQHLFHPSSVLDLGCGIGYWIKVWKDELAVEDVLGIEGSYVTEDMFFLGKNGYGTVPLCIRNPYSIIYHIWLIYFILHCTTVYCIIILLDSI